MKNKFPLVLMSLILLVIGFGACKKEVTLTNNNLTLSQLVDKAIGKYTSTQYCSSGNSIGGYTYDTAYNVTIVISTSDDTTIIFNGTQMYFSGNLSAKQYSFYSPSSGGGYHFQFDSLCHNINFGYWDGGLGGGSGCSGFGTK